LGRTDRKAEKKEKRSLRHFCIAEKGGVSVRGEKEVQEKKKDAWLVRRKNKRSKKRAPERRENL